MTLHLDLQPYAALTPDLILTSLEVLGLRPDGRLLALNSYENRVYQIGMDTDAPLIAKYYRPDRWSVDAILEEHAFLTALDAAEVPVVAPIALNQATLHTHEAFHFALFRKCGGRAPELDHEDTLEWIGRFLGRIHAVGSVHDFKHRPSLNIQTFGVESYEYLISHQFIPQDLQPAYTTVVEQALEAIGACYSRAGSIKNVRLHGDCHIGNMLWTNDGPHFVDFDDSRMGPAVQDIWMLLSGDRQAMLRQLDVVLSGYEQFHTFNPDELHLVEALRTLRLIHYSAWIARRWQDPAFPAAFTWFNTPQYWQNRILELREQLALMSEPPLIQNFNG